jgi:hypothetical protein
MQRLLTATAWQIQPQTKPAISPMTENPIAGNTAANTRPIINNGTFGTQQIAASPLRPIAMVETNAIRISVRMTAIPLADRWPCIINTLVINPNACAWGL